MRTEVTGQLRFMMKEIHEQPAAVRDTLFPRLKDGKMILFRAHSDEDAIRGIHRIYVRLQGSCLPCGHGRAQPHPAGRRRSSEFRYRDRAGAGFSRAGHQPEAAKPPTPCSPAPVKDRHVARGHRPNVVGSSIAREADAAILHLGRAGPVATTKAYGAPGWKPATCWPPIFARVRSTLADGQYENLISRSLTEKIEKTLHQQGAHAVVCRRDYTNAKDTFLHRPHVVAP